MTTTDPNDLTYAEALEDAQPRIAEMHASVTALLDQAQTFWRDTTPTIQAWAAQVKRMLLRLWAQIVRCIQQQWPLSPALAYATPTMRRRAARQRAHVAMQAKNRRG